jgi:hypothetical protein
MQQEAFYGFNDGTDYHDKPAQLELAAPAAAEEVATTPHLDLQNSNSRLDFYLFYYSSRL